MSVQASPTSLPRSLHRFFWDVDPLKVNPAEKPHYVINRLLDKGDLAAARWVLRNFPKEMIVDTLKKIRDFSPRSARFWATYLGVSEEKVICLQPSYLAMRRTHWPY